VSGRVGEAVGERYAEGGKVTSRRACYGEWEGERGGVMWEGEVVRREKAGVGDVCICRD